MLESVDFAFRGKLLANAAKKVFVASRCRRNNLVRKNKIEIDENKTIAVSSKRAETSQIAIRVKSI